MRLQRLNGNEILWSVAPKRRNRNAASLSQCLSKHAAASEVRGGDASNLENGVIGVPEVLSGRCKREYRFVCERDDINRERDNRPVKYL